MGALLAEFQFPERNVDQRRAPRRHLRLLTDARGANGDFLTTISNLSRTGLLIDTPVELSVGEPIEVDLPESDTVTAYVIWTSGTLSGCQFGTILSQATVSAAQLLWPANWAPQIAAPAIEGDLETRIRRARRQYSVIATAALLVVALAVATLLVGLIRAF